MGKRPDVSIRNKSKKQREAVSNGWNKGNAELRKKRIGEANKIALIGNKCALGHKLNINVKNKIIKNLIPFDKGENHPGWKGDNIKYNGLHVWISSQLGKPNRCDSCGTTENKIYNWANKSGKYKRDLNDWIRLCLKCHRNKDNWSNKMWKTRKENLLRFELP